MAISVSEHTKYAYYQSVSIDKINLMFFKLVLKRSKMRVNLKLNVTKVIHWLCLLQTVS